MLAPVLPCAGLLPAGRRPDRADAVGLLLLSIGLNLLKPWPLALLVDSVLGAKPFPGWLPDGVTTWGQPAQITAIVAASLALHLVHAAACAGHVVPLDRRRASGACGGSATMSSAGSSASRSAITTGPKRGTSSSGPGTDTCAFQILFLHGLLIFVSATGTLLFMAVAMARLNLHLTAVALVAVPILLLSIKVFGRAMRLRGTAAQQAEGKVYALIHQGITALPLIQSHAREHHEQQRFTDAHRGSAAAQDGAAGSRGLLLGLDLGDPERVHARGDLGGRAAGAGLEPDGGGAAGLPRLRRPALRAAPSALAGGRHAVER